jgi:HEPN domain-containing protein
MMNERIQEFILQCTDTIEVVNEDSGITHHREFFVHEKFAELIVQECLMKAIGAKIRGESIDTLIQNIKEDFGVE